MLNDVYSEKLLAAAAAVPPARRLETPDASATKVSRICGSELTVDVRMEDGRIADIGLVARACALGQAAAGLTLGAVIGATPDEIFALRREMRGMLKEGGPPPSGGRWAGLEGLTPIRDYPQRHGSALLIFEALAACMRDLGYTESAPDAAAIADFD